MVYWGFYLFFIIYQIVTSSLLSFSPVGIQLQPSSCAQYK